MKTFIPLVAALLLGAPQGKKPNVIVIMADDLGAEVLNCYGGTSYKTPHLDALAKSGIRFENAFSTPLCSPTRAMLMTGRYGFRTGWTQLIDNAKDEYFDPKKEKSFGRMMKEAGYATGIAGKWQLCLFAKHPDHLRECGFDESCMWTWVADGKRTDRYWNPSIWQDGKPLAETQGKYGPDIFCDFAINFIKRHKNEPFFFYYPMALIHNPFEASPDSADRKAKGDKTLPDMVAYMDKIVGRIVATLDELRLRENTLVIFTGDNGTTRGIPSKAGEATVIGGKGSMLDTGSHVPLIASWPGTIAKGQVLDDLIDLSDVVPTLGDLCGAKLPQGVPIDGRSFAARLRGESGNPRDWVFVQLGKNRFVRDKKWKLHSDGRLFDIAKDPFEKSPVPDGGEATSARKRLEEALAKLK